MTVEEQAKADAEAKVKADALAKIEELAKAAGVKVYPEKEMQESITRRQEALEKLRVRDEEDKKAADLKAKEEQDKQVAQGKTKEVLEAKIKEIAALQLTLDSANEKAAKYEAEQKAIREQALAKIKDEKLRTLAAKFTDVADVVAFAEMNSGTKVNPFTGQPVEGQIIPKKYKNFQEWQKDMEDNQGFPHQSR
jgi:hypothetical protein